MTIIDDKGITWIESHIVSFGTQGSGFTTSIDTTFNRAGTPVALSIGTSVRAADVGESAYSVRAQVIGTDNPINTGWFGAHQTGFRATQRNDSGSNMNIVGFYLIHMRKTG